MKDWKQEIHTAYCGTDGKLWLTASKFYRANNALFVSVDLIGGKNQVILEFPVSYSNRDTEYDHVKIGIYYKVDGKLMHHFPYNNSKLCLG